MDGVRHPHDRVRLVVRDDHRVHQQQRVHDEALHVEPARQVARKEEEDGPPAFVGALSANGIQGLDVVEFSVGLALDDARALDERHVHGVRRREAF